jgi:aspartate aminotransferase-like enzyme
VFESSHPLIRPLASHLFFQPTLLLLSPVPPSRHPAVNTESDAVIMTGEGMVALWGALKSVLRPGDKVLAVDNGLFGQGVGQMAESLGAQVVFVSSDWRKRIDPSVVIAAIQEHRPSLVTMIHCETPSGLLNPLDGIGAAAHEVNALFYVDFVSSAGGVPVNRTVDEYQIDLGLLGSQKVLSCLPDMSVVFVSRRAWEVIERVNYPGYDALWPFKNAVTEKYFPYTPNWHGVLALKASVSHILKSGLAVTFKQHDECAHYCRQRIRDFGLELYPLDEESCSPTATAVKVRAHNIISKHFNFTASIFRLRFSNSFVF